MRKYALLRSRYPTTTERVGLKGHCVASLAAYSRDCTVNYADQTRVTPAIDQLLTRRNLHVFNDYAKCVCIPCIYKRF